MLSNRSRVGGCHDQRRLLARTPSPSMRLGRTVRTLKRRMAFTRGQHRGPRCRLLAELAAGFHRPDGEGCLMRPMAQLGYGRRVTGSAKKSRPSRPARVRTAAPKRADATPTADSAFVDDTE